MSFGELFGWWAKNHGVITCWRGDGGRHLKFHIPGTKLEVKRFTNREIDSDDFGTIVASAINELYSLGSEYAPSIS